jgi:hypothetical protein
MSGPGSSGGGDGRGPEIPQIECSRISERTVLNSPVPDVVSILKNGDILEIEVQNRTSLVAITKEGNIAGALTLPLLPRIVECIEEGFKYVAIVVSVSGGECRVHVKSGSKV